MAAGISAYDRAGLLLHELQSARARVDLNGIAFAELTLQHTHRQTIQDVPLNRAFQRPRTIGGIVAFAHEPFFGGVGERDEDLPFLEPLQQAFTWMSTICFISSRLSGWKMMISSMRLMNSGLKCARSASMHLTANAFVDAALAELGEKRAAEVRRHDDDRVLEVDRAALAVGQPAVVEELQQDVEHFGMRLFDLVEQDDRVRPPPHGLGELAAFLVADVSRRRTDQPRDGVLLLYSDMSMRTIACSSSNRNSASARAISVLPTPVGPRKMNGPIGRFGILQPSARAAHGVGDRLDGFVLADDALVEPLFHG